MPAHRDEWPDFDAYLEDAYARGWTDGLPVVPATPEKVASFLAAAGSWPGARVPAKTRIWGAPNTAAR